SRLSHRRIIDDVTQRTMRRVEQMANIVVAEPAAADRHLSKVRVSGWGALDELDQQIRCVVDETVKDLKNGAILSLATVHHNSKLLHQAHIIDPVTGSNAGRK